MWPLDLILTEEMVILAGAPDSFYAARIRMKIAMDQFIYAIWSALWSRT
jgi:hypothetical protein